MHQFRRAAFSRPLVSVAMLSLVAGALVGCDSTPPARPRVVQPVVRDVPAVLNNTVGSVSTLNGTEPIVVFGYGLVVGLNGTGGGELDEALASQMEAEMSRRNISSSLDYRGTALDGKGPKALLRDKNVAVVLVQAAIPPAAPKGMVFDAYVTAINATSLEGGTLWSTDMAVQTGPSGTIGGLKGRRLAVARGPVFINPFSDPASDRDQVSRRTGRVLAGGALIEPLKMEIVLDEQSHARARRIVEAINTRFPEEPGARGKTAMGRSGTSIALTVPPSMFDEAPKFVQIVRHLQIDIASPESFAKRYTDALKEQPWLATDLQYCLIAVGGDPTIQFVRTMYEYPEIVPRMTALRVGAALGDHKCTEHLIKIAQIASGPERFEAINMLRDIEGGPTIDMALRELLNSAELLVRVSAYETLAYRAEGNARARALREAAAVVQNTGDVSLQNPTHRDVLLRGAIPGRNVQGVRREIIGDKFQLDLVPGGEPMMYVTQQGQPRIVLFGGPMKLEKPLLVTAWEDRLIITADVDSPKIRLYYRDYKTNKISKEELDDSLESFVAFLARKSSIDDPRPGLDLTYSEVVGALYALHQQRGVICQFATESDKLRAQLAEAGRDSAPKVRPETPEDREELNVIQQPSAPDVQANRDRPAGQPARNPVIIPIIRPKLPEAAKPKAE